jgi:hypothetical protein
MADVNATGLVEKQVLRRRTAVHNARPTTTFVRTSESNHFGGARRTGSSEPPLQYSIASRALASFVSNANPLNSTMLWCGSTAKFPISRLIRVVMFSVLSEYDGESSMNFTAITSPVRRTREGRIE